MKKLYLFLWAASTLFPGCRGQENKLFVNEEKQKLTSFEEKQKQALQKEEVRFANSLTAVFNFRYAAKRATPGVVHIKSAFPVTIKRDVPDFFRDFFGDDFWQHYFEPNEKTPQLQMGSASGVIISDDGYIVTNNHVVEQAETIEVILHDQRTYKAKLIGTDPSTDLALLKIDERKLSFIEFGNSDSVEVGDVVLAVGNPFNLASTVTAGIVSAKARNISILTDKAAIESYIQTDAAVNKGNSGGALVDINGKLVGINSAIATPTGAYAGYSFAIPVEMVKKTIDDLLKHGKVLRGYLGIIISDMTGEKAKVMGVNITAGVLVDSVQPNGAAMMAGMAGKDIITKIDNHNIETSPQLREIIARHKPGEKIYITVTREGKEKVIPVTLMPVQQIVAAEIPVNQILTTLGIEIENLSGKEINQLKITGGVKVVSISTGKINRYTNMQAGFIITGVNGKAVKNKEEFIREIKDKKGGIMLEGIYPGATGVYYYAFGL